MPDERAAIDDVGRYWDAYILGDETAASAIDPDLAATIQRIHHLSSTPPAASRHRVWKEVLANVDAKQAPRQRSVLRAIPVDSPVVLAPSGPVLPERFRHEPRWSFAPLATAALVLLTLIGSFFAFGPGRHGRVPPQAIYLPAAEATPATPAPNERSPLAQFLWETHGDPSQPLTNAEFLAIDGDGNLWASDVNTRQFQVFAPDGTFLETWNPISAAVDALDLTAGRQVFGGRTSIAFDADGNRYVVDGDGKRVLKFAPDGTPLLAWGESGRGVGQFLAPSSIAADGTGRIYVLDNERSDVQIFDTSGRFVATLGSYGFADDQFYFAYSGAVAVDAHDNVWISDVGNQRIKKFSPDGRFLGSFGGYGTREGNLNTPGQVSVSSQGTVFVPDFSTAQVKAFTGNGIVVGAWGAKGGDPGEFYTPASVVLDGQGNIYVGEGDGRVQKFKLRPPLAPRTFPRPSPSATPALAPGSSTAHVLWQSTGGPNLPLTSPGRVAVAPDGNLWVVDGPRNAFQVFSPDGAYLESWGAPGSGPGQFAMTSHTLGTAAIAFDAGGAMYVADPGNHRMQKFAADRTFLETWDTKGTEDGQFLAPCAITVDSAGLVYVTDCERSDVQVFDETGRYLNTIGEPGVGEGQLSLAYGGATAIGSAGNIWVADGSNQRIQKFSAQGEFLATIGGYGFTDGKFARPTGLAIDDRDRIFVSDTGATGPRVQVFSPDGTFLAKWQDAAGTAGDHATVDIALDGHGNMYLSDLNGNRVLKLRLLPPLAGDDAAAGADSPVDDAPAVELLWQTDVPPDQLLTNPGLLAVDGGGNVWVPNPTTSQFQIVSPNGEFLEAWGTPGSGDGEFDFTWEPQPVASGAAAFGPEGSIFVVDPGNFRVQKFAPDRTFLLDWGSQGTGDGQFVSPDSIAVDPEGRVFVADRDRDDIQVFDSEGRYLITIGSFGFGEGQFYFFCGSGLAFAANGDLLVSDGCNHRLQRFTAEGDYRATIGGVGAGEARFHSPSQIAVDKAGRIYVADYSNYRVQVLNPDGIFLAEIGREELGPAFGPNGIAVDTQGTVFMSDIDEDRLLALRFAPFANPGSG